MARLVRREPFREEKTVFAVDRLAPVQNVMKQSSQLKLCSLTTGATPCLQLRLLSTRPFWSSHWKRVPKPPIYHISSTLRLSPIVDPSCPFAVVPATCNDLLNIPVISPFGHGQLDLRHGLRSPRRYGSRHVPPRTTKEDDSCHDAVVSMPQLPCLSKSIRNVPSCRRIGVTKRHV